MSDKIKKVLCVCSVNRLRSPTAAEVLSQSPFNFNTRSCGIDLDFAIVPISKNLLHWADEIVCMERHHFIVVLELLDKFKIDGKRILKLDIEDKFEFRSNELKELIESNYNSK